ncbi:hypothetical protein ISS22_16655 [candidate division KSB1 bacterium]|nr:hypothetical protein [candidate division KSB1 bacterium]
MKLLKLFIEKSLYLSINLLIFLAGYIFILKGYSNESQEFSKKGAILISIGTSLIAAGIVVFLDLWKEISKDRIFDKIKSLIIQGGLNKVYPKRDLDKYDDLMFNLKNNLDITGYSLVAFYDSYCELLITKVVKHNLLKIRILVVDPDSEFSKHRAVIEGNMPDIYKNNINRMIEKFSKYSNIQIKIISSPLTTMIFRIDNTIFVGPHFYKKSSKSTLTFEINKNGWIFDEYMYEFERMWEDASDLK